MSKKDVTMKSKVCLYKTGKKAKKLNIWANTKSMDRLNELGQFYEAVLEREVSYSLVVRRAVEVLLEHIRGIKSGNKLRDYHKESIQIMKHR